MSRRLNTLAGLALAAILFAGPSAAQQPAAVEYRFTVSLEELSVIGKGLDDQPYKVAAPIIAKLNRQIIAQQAAASKPADGAGAEKPTGAPEATAAERKE